MDPGIVAAWAAAIATLIAAIAAVVGPIVSVKMAHWMMELENKKLEAAKLFRDITHDIELFKTSVKDSIVSVGAANATHARIEMLDKESDSYNKDLERELRDRDRDVGWVERAINNVLEYRAILSADKMAVRLLFGDNGSECEKAIEVVIRLGDELPPFNKETIEDDMYPFAVANAKVIEEMEKLFKRLTKKA